MSKAFDKIQRYLFDDDIPLTDKQFTPHELIVRDRYRTIFVYWLDKPLLSDKKILQFIQNEFHVTYRQALRDLQDVKLLLGNITNASKEWHRLKLLTMIDETYMIAKEKRNPIAMAAVIDKLGKYTQLDKEDTEKIPYDQIVPQTFEPTGDVSVLGLKPMPNLREEQARLRRKYKSSLIEDVDFEDSNDETETEI